MVPGEEKEEEEAAQGVALEALGKDGQAEQENGKVSVEDPEGDESASAVCCGKEGVVEEDAELVSCPENSVQKTDMQPEKVGEEEKGAKVVIGREGVESEEEEKPIAGLREVLVAGKDVVLKDEDRETEGSDDVDAETCVLCEDRITSECHESAENEPNGEAMACAMTGMETVVEEKTEEKAAAEERPVGEKKSESEDKSESVEKTVSEGVTGVEEKEEESPAPEFENVSIPVHWHPKPCVHIAGLGGSVSIEELLLLITQHAPVSSIVFENEKRDAAIVRLESTPTEADHMVSTVKEALNNAQYRDKTFVVEPFRPDSLLFIGNLTPEIDDEALQKMFEPHGKVERAFVLRNQEGRSKGYGFVEYSLKSQASAAKQIMENINMDGRVLRVEWSDCRKVAEMFSTVLFVDRIAKECPNIENILKTLFGEYGKVRDCHLAIGMSQQFRGFAFIDFNHSTYADKAHEALDGKEVESSNIRVSFANPSKSAQSYKSRFGSQVATGGLSGRGFPVPVTPAMMGAAIRSQMAMPLLAPRFLGPRPGMLGMGIGMQFGRGAPIGPGMIGRGLVSPFLGAGGSMLGPGCIAGMMGRGAGLILGPVPIPSAAIAQVATAQAKAREEEAKFRRLQQAPQQAQTTQQTGQSLYQQQTQASPVQDGQYSYHQVYQQATQPSIPQQQQYSGQQPDQSYASQYYSQLGQQQYVQQQAQPTYYQLESSAQIPTSSQQQLSQYAQQYGQQYSPQQHVDAYNQTSTQQYAQQYQQASSQSQYAQQEYGDYYAQQQQTQESQHRYDCSAAPSATAAASVTAQVLDTAQQQVYASYYQQRALQAASQATSSGTQPTTAGDLQQSLEAQWAAYYAAQQAVHQNGAASSCDQPGNYSQHQTYNGSAATTSAGYYQQPAISDIGQKRSADQMDYTLQTLQNSYNYQQPAVSRLQASSSDGIYQHQATSAVTGYQQPAASSVYQLPSSAVYIAGHQQPANAAVPTHQQLSSASYQQQPAGTYQQMSQTVVPVTTAVYDYSKKSRY